MLEVLGKKPTNYKKLIKNSGTTIVKRQKQKWVVGKRRCYFPRFEERGRCLWASWQTGICRLLSFAR